MDATIPLSWTLEWPGLPEEGRKVRFDAAPADRARLADHAGILGIDALRVEGDLRPWAGGVEARLRLVADVTQACVVSLGPVPQHIDERFVRRFLPAAQLGDDVREVAVEIAPDEDDPPEPLISETVDLGPAIAEELILALDPYPRAPGAKARADTEAPQKEASPFAVLKGLKDPP